MFNRKTVFILGAGASWHYGYPTGEELVKKVIEKAEIIGHYFAERSSRDIGAARPIFVEMKKGPDSPSPRRWWALAAQDCFELAKRLRQINPLVIDYFLGQNPLLRDVGKLIIAWVILECEARSETAGYNTNRQYNFDSLGREYQDDWYRFVLHKLITNCRNSSDLVKNKVSFVTFNYDVSLDTNLAERLNAIEMFDSQDIENFLGAGRIVHVYGKVREHNISREKSELEQFATGILSGRGRQASSVASNMEAQCKLDAAFTASQALHLIAPLEKSNNQQEMIAARAQISEADCLYILGYGFDGSNSDLLNLGAILRYHDNDYRPAVMFTNFGNSNRVNRAFARLRFGNAYAHPLPDILPGGRLAQNCEVSFRDVYGAFDQDFDSIEEG